MASSERVLVDTSSFYSLISFEGDLHLQARIAYERLIDWEWEIWTTSLVIVKLSSLINADFGMNILITSMDTIFNTIKVIGIENSILDEAWKRMQRSQTQNLNLNDWTTIIASEKLQASIFATSKSFGNEGVPLFPL